MEKYLAKHRILEEASKLDIEHGLTALDLSQLLNLPYDDIFTYCDGIIKSGYVKSFLFNNGRLIIFKSPFGISFLNEGGFIKEHEIEVEKERKEKIMQEKQLEQIQSVIDSNVSGLKTDISVRNTNRIIKWTGGLTLFFIFVTAFIAWLQYSKKDEVHVPQLDSLSNEVRQLRIQLQRPDSLNHKVSHPKNLK